MKAKTIFIIGLFLIVGIVACKKDDDTTQTDTAINRTNYVGTWSCTETQATKLYFDCTISLDATTASNIKITNFANLHETAFAIINGNSVILPKQTFSNNTFEGFGSMDNSKNLITWHYYVKDNTDSLVYNTTFNRK